MFYPGSNWLLVSLHPLTMLEMSLLTRIGGSIKTTFMLLKFNKN